jgi:hypothetical protein
MRSAGGVNSISAGDSIAGRYRVERPLDRDPLFSSFTATDQREGQDVLLLAVNPKILSSARDHRLFLRRIERTIFLNTPGTAKVHLITSERGQSLIIGDMMHGLSLRSFIDTKRRMAEPITSAEGISILRAIANVLEAAPARAHGYLIPNLVFLEEQSPVLVAFGLTTALPAERLIEAFARDTAVRRYLAPEVRGGRFGEIGSDIYSLAVLAADLLGARRPKEILGRVLDATIDERPRSSLTLVHEIEAALSIAEEIAIELLGDEAPDDHGPPPDLRQVSKTIQTIAVDPPGAEEASNQARVDQDAPRELDPGLVRAALFLHSAESQGLDGCPGRDLESQQASEPSAEPSDPQASSRPVRATATDWHILQPRIVAVSSSQAAGAPEFLPRAPVPEVDVPPAASVESPPGAEAPPKNALARWVPDPKKRVESPTPLIVPSSDSWSWGLLFVHVGGLLLLVSLVAIVAVILMD